MSFAPQLLGRGWCFDSVHPFTATDATRLKAASWVGPTLALWRYVSLGAPSPADITVAEVSAILGAGWLLGLVQHVQRPSWQADPASGLAHGKAATDHAALVSYPQGCHIGLDMEGLGDSGAPVVGYVVAWADAVHAAGYRVLLYLGYDDGIADTAMGRLVAGGYIDALWSDYGPRTLPTGLSFALKQHAQTTVVGIGVDPDEVLSPGVIAVMGLAVPSEAITLDDLPPEPHTDPGGTNT
jgi:hypothetical protein